MRWWEKDPDESTLRAREMYVSQNIEIGTQPIYANHEFTIIDDTDPNFVVVEDETGMVRTIPREKKNDSSAWILAAIAAGLMLL